MILSIIGVWDLRKLLPSRRLGYGRSCRRRQDRGTGRDGIIIGIDKSCDY